MRLAIRLALVAVLVAGWLAGRPRGVAAEAVPDWRRDPLQEPTDREPFTLATREGKVTVTPRAAYDVAARVARIEPYRFDRTAFLSPFDFALAWGDVGGETILPRLSIRQNARFYFWTAGDPSIDVEYVIAHSANTHLVPASANVRRALAAADRGDVVRLRGLLVDIDSERGLTWRTSLVREDHGDGGCEILWVESVQIGDRLYA